MRKGWKLEKLFDVGRAHHELYLACLAPTPPTAKNKFRPGLKKSVLYNQWEWKENRGGFGLFNQRPNDFSSGRRPFLQFTLSKTAGRRTFFEAEGLAGGAGGGASLLRR